MRYDNENIVLHSQMSPFDRFELNSPTHFRALCFPLTLQDSIIWADGDADLSTDEALTNETDQETHNTIPWGIDRIDSRLGTDGEYNSIATGEGVTIFIADGGVYPFHSEWTGRFAGCSDFSGQGCVSNNHGTHVGKSSWYRLVDLHWLCPV